MTQGFDDWFEKRHTKSGWYEKTLLNDDDALYLKKEMSKSHKAGAASRQVEIDELKQRITMLEIDVHTRDKMINDALDMLEGRKGKVLFDDIVDTLKGESNE